MMVGDYLVCIIMIPTLVLLFLLLSTSVAQQNRRTTDNRPYMYNILSHNEEYLLKVQVKEGEEVLVSRDYEMRNSLEQPEIIENITLSLDNLQHNITLSATLYKLHPFMELAHTFRNLTKYQKVLKVDENEFGGSYDPIDQISPSKKQQEEESEVQYDLHVAVDFNVMIVYSNIPILASDPIPPNTDIKKLPIKLNGKQFYTTGVDVSQMHIPFRSYRRVSAGQHNVTLHLFPYDVVRQAMFYPLGHPEKMGGHMGPLKEMMQLMLDENAIDQMKEILFTNHVYLVTIYFLLSLTQTILRFYTLRLEYNFWKNIQNNRGVSLKTIFYQVVFSAVITLYLYEHNSSKLVIFFSFLDIATAIWKISRTFTLRLENAFPWVRLQASELYKKREKIDSQAVWYMNYLLVPLMAAYLWWALYSRNYTIKDWYNFLLETAVAFIAVFGFIMMTPQLYINYRLKSVDHLNWKGLIYRFINTLLDDLFAFMVTMPNLRRLMYFRDDVIFLIYLYQRRIYRVDPSRRAPLSDPAPIPVPRPASAIPLKQE